MRRIVGEGAGAVAAVAGRKVVLRAALALAIACAGLVVWVAAGAAGFISKHITGAELCAAIHAVKRGEAAISPDLLGHLMRGLRREPGGNGGMSATGALTVSELKVLRLVADGRTDKQISATLYISPRTVQSHLAHIRAKIGISRRTQLACWATEHAVT